MKRRLCSATLNLLFGEVAVAVTVVVCFYKEEDIFKHIRNEPQNF